MENCKIQRNITKIAIIAILALLIGSSVRIAHAEEPGKISPEAAKEIALIHAGLVDSDVRFSEIKLEREKGHPVYEIEFYACGMEYEYTINALTGTILEYNTDVHD